MRRFHISRKKIILFLVSFFVVGFLRVWYRPCNRSRRVQICGLLREMFIPVTESLAPSPHSERLIRATVYGDVMRPGTYVMRQGSRVKDLLASAGPIPEPDLQGTDTERIIEDGYEIVVKRKPSGIEGAISSLGIGKSPEESYLVEPFRIYELEDQSSR